VQRTRKPPLSSGATSAIIKPTNLPSSGITLAPLPSFPPSRDLSTLPSTRPSSKGVKRPFRPFHSLSFPPDLPVSPSGPLSYPKSSLSALRSLALPLQRLDGKKRICATFSSFAESTASTEFSLEEERERERETAGLARGIRPGRLSLIGFFNLERIANASCNIEHAAYSDVFPCREGKGTENRRSASHTRSRRDTSRENGGQIRVTDTKDLSGNVLFKREADRGSRKERMPLK